MATCSSVCPFCLGSGLCYRCRGTGFHKKVWRQPRPCEECEGTGRCALCEGAGQTKGGEPHYVPDEEGEQ